MYALSILGSIAGAEASIEPLKALWLNYDLKTSMKLDH
jgi:hypothetical protein